MTDSRGPVQGALVRIRGAAGRPAQTDATGRFHLGHPVQASDHVTAWKSGYFIAGAPAYPLPAILALTPLPVLDNEEYTWIDPRPDPARGQQCGNCHAEIYREWSASGHAESATKRRFRSLYDGTDWSGRRTTAWNLLAEYPDGAGVCTACHAPTVAFDDPAYFDLRKLRGTAARGVHCDYCHKISDVDRDRIGLTHGRFGLHLLRPKQGQLFMGPLDDVDRGEDTFSPLYKESLYCASCHEGIVFGVHVYSTYSEWLGSKARKEGKQCQSCHMTPTGRLTNIAPGHGGLLRDPLTLGDHRFFAGGQAEMLRRSLRLNVRVRPVAEGGQVDVSIRATDVGHRVPTGFVDRNLALVVEAFAMDGSKLGQAGGTPVLPDPAGPSLRGLPGKLFAKQLTDFDGLCPTPFWRAQPGFSDSRLRPDEPEHITFRFAGRMNRIRVRLIYRRFWEDVVVLKGWPDDRLILVDQTLKTSPGTKLDWANE